MSVLMETIISDVYRETLMVISVYFLLCILIMNYCAKNALDLPNENTMIILAILLAGEVNFWKRR